MVPIDPILRDDRVKVRSPDVDNMGRVLIDRGTVPSRRGHTGHDNPTVGQQRGELARADRSFSSHSATTTLSRQIRDFIDRPRVCREQTLPRRSDRQRTAPSSTHLRVPLHRLTIDRPRLAKPLRAQLTNRDQPTDLDRRHTQLFGSLLDAELVHINQPIRLIGSLPNLFSGPTGSTRWRASSPRSQRHLARREKG